MGLASVRAVSRSLTPEQAKEFIADAEFIWHQRFELAPGVYTPGANDMAAIFERCGVPARLDGARALDVGTTNGGAAFELERRGAEVVAVDIEDSSWFGFEQLRALLDSSVAFVQTSVYELSERFTEPFDLVLFWGLLYHLRHPLLGLDNLRGVTRGRALLETAVADASLVSAADQSLARFYRRDELAGDASNWFEPTITALCDWCVSSGFETETLAAWPESAPSRCLVSLVPTVEAPEYRRISGETPLHCSVESR